MECADTAVGRPGYMELSSLDFVIAKNLIPKCRQNAVRPFKEQIAIERRRTHDDISASFGFRAPISLEHVGHDVHRLPTSRESQYHRIIIRWIVIIRKNDFVVHRQTGKPGALL